VRFDGVGNAAETADRLALSGRLARQVRGASETDGGGLLHALDFDSGAFDEAELLFRGRAVLARRQTRVQIAEPPPRAQVFLVITRTQRTGVFDGKF
jgi:hypothetical protein